MNSNGNGNSNKMNMNNMDGKGGGSGSKCGRWNPTSEQVKVLTELFKSGLRTPSSDQIQKISNQLSFYGKIESKNVFYWFQNHKARDRHKRRKVLDDIHHLHHHHHHHHHNNTTYSSSTAPNYFEETNMGIIMENERSVRKTLQLFPLNSRDESELSAETEAEQMRQNGENENQVLLQYEERTAADLISYKIETKMDHPPLDLRLSFV